MAKKLKHTTVARKRNFFKETLFLILVGVLASIAVYSAYEPEAALGLVENTAFAQAPVRLNESNVAVLEDAQFLELALPSGAVNDTQADGVWFDPTTPPAVEAFTAYNTRVGNEVALSWRLPEGVSGVNLYRQDNGSAQKSQLLENAQLEAFVDDTVKDGQVVTYAITAVIEYKGETYESGSEFARTATVTVQDEIAPLIPTELSVTTAETGGLLVTWVNPEDEDVVDIQLYRSQEWGVRGERIARFTLSDNETLPQEYTDINIEPYISYYYTVVAADAAGNESSTDIDIPPVGNQRPFESFNQSENEEEDQL